MMQCSECEFFEPDELGNPGFRCDPFRNIKEEACLAKWQIIQLNQMLASQQANSAFQAKLAPLQEKMFKIVSREVEELEESESWKTGYDDDHEASDDEDEENPWEQKDWTPDY